ncbi:hypothetical protein LTR16_005344, partial [Cryomyces antarcticus]
LLSLRTRFVTARTRPSSRSRSLDTRLAVCLRGLGAKKSRSTIRGSRSTGSRSFGRICSVVMAVRR